YDAANPNLNLQNPIYYFCTFCKEVKKEEAKFTETIHDMTTGNGLVYTIGITGGATFTSVADIKDFLKVSIDGIPIKLGYIKIKEGSTIVTISSEYMDTLPNGQHTVSIYSTTGTATAKFTVVGNKETPTTPEIPTTPTTPENPETPSTGDSGNMPLWIGLLFVSGGALTLFGINKKRRKVDEK
ncbi:MAG: LPXTG cell wall anchor domain-containing protein, partial [Oscillospiraceae bacterium]